MARAAATNARLEEARVRALESTTADDLLVVVAIKRQLGTLKRYLKISMDDA